MQFTVQAQAVLQLIETGQATSQVHIARVLGVPPNTIHGVVRRLEGSRLVCRDRLDKNQRGRPIQHYRINKPGSVLSIQWLGSVWYAGIYLNDRARGPVQTGHLPPIKDLDKAFDLLKQMRDQTLSSAGLALSDLSGIILNINGARTVHGRVLSSSVVPWIRRASQEHFSDALECKVQLDLRMAGVIPELRARAAEGVNSLVVLNVGDGVSAHGASVDSQWGSERNYKGELGHVVMDPKGPLCGCGHRGCLEALISGPALLQRVEADVKSGIQTSLSNMVGKPPAELFSELERLYITGNDSYAGTLVEEFLERVAWCVSLILNVVGPDVIVLNGYAVEGRDVWRERILQKSRSLTLYGESEDIHLEFPKLRREDCLRDLARSFKSLPMGGHDKSVSGK